MSNKSSLLRKTHFVGAKIRALRKQNDLTLEDLSIRCIQIDRDAAPSVSYLSMIENGKRVPSGRLLKLLSEVFQKPESWFLDEHVQAEAAPKKASGGGIEGIPLEPGFLFSKELLETAIPELLAQTGTNGRQFAHLLIRSYQEARQNRFPDLERAAEEIGRKQFPLNADDLQRFAKRQGLKIRWFDKRGSRARTEAGRAARTFVRSFFDAPNTVYLNRALESQPQRLKYDLATHIGHSLLHDGDGLRSPQTTGVHPSELGQSHGINPQDILYAWRDFECSFFAGALLCPRLPFRQFLTRHAYSVEVGKQLDLSPSVVMRRMTSVSPYRHWHFFDAYPPGQLRAVYRGNGIPLPWGNMRLVDDPCRHWAVFRMLNSQKKRPFAQISILKDVHNSHLYCCESVRTRDVAGNMHVLCVGIELVPALESQGINPGEVVSAIDDACCRSGGSAEVPQDAHEALTRVSKVLNIGWITKGLESPANLICPRSSACPRPQHCTGTRAKVQRSWFETLRDEIRAEG